MIQILSSLQLAFYNLLLLVFLLAGGVVLALSQADVFAQMNEMPILRWLTSTIDHTPSAAYWFLALCTVSAALLVNAVCCTFSRQLALARKSPKNKPRLFFILHCFFILVLLCHGLIIVTGEKESGVRLSPGSTHIFGPYRICVDDVDFKNDPALLLLPKDQQRRHMTRANVRIRDNTVKIRLMQSGRPVAEKQVYMLSPLRYKSLQVTLVKFFIEPGKQHPGAVLTITDNLFNLFFFAAYGLMILALAGFTALTWRVTPSNKGEKNAP